MTYTELRKEAKSRTGLCHSCPVCTGAACAGVLPGPGDKGIGKTALRNYNAWQNIYLNMDTITEERPVNTNFTMFGETFSYPIFAAPLGAVSEHYSDALTQKEYDNALLEGCAKSGIGAFTGDGLHDEYFPDACQAIHDHGFGIPTIKPWSKDRVFQRIDIARAAGVKAMCMDIDGSGLPFLKNMNPPSGTKTVQELREIIEYAGIPFLIKGIMTPKAAQKALDAGAAGIVVSNHGGRVLDQTPATAWVLPAIAEAVGDYMMILVDGGIRTGLDVFKALALGADAVLIGRPFANCVFGAGAEGVQVYVNQLGAELRDAMQMCGPRTLAKISSDHIWGGSVR